MKNKKLFISLFSCVLTLSSGFIASTTVGAGTNDLTISTLSGEMVDGDDLFSDDNICIVDIIEEEDTPLSVIGDNNSKSRNLSTKELDQIQESLMDSINATRKVQAANKTVTELSTLEKTGTVRANEITKKWSHTRPNGQSWVTVLTSYGISKNNLKAGENLAKISMSAKSTYSSEQLEKLSKIIHQSLMDSPTHRQVILNQSYKKAGIGIYSEVKNDKLTIYITEHFKNDNAEQKVASKVNVSQLTYSKINNKVYTGKQIKPSLTVKYKGKTLKKGTDYTLSYGTNKATGKATVKISGKGNYTGSVTKTFYIVPKKVSTPTLKAGKKSITVKYKKVTGASGYQIAYQKSGSKSWTYTTVSSASKTLTKLTSKKNYKVKVRAYKTVSGKKYYGTYSATKTVKVK